jgi:hypothetical protein
MIEYDHWHLRQTQLSSRSEPCVPGDDAGRTVDEDGIGEAKLPDACGNLIDLPL